MNKNLILVSRKQIIIHIFTLVCKKLNISLTVLSEAQLDQKVDIVVIDSEFIDDRFNILKSYSKLIGAISKEELSFETANDFRIPLPFLPSSLQIILEEQLEVLNKRVNSKMYISNVEVAVDEDELITSNLTPEEDSDQAIDYLESLADDIADDMNDELDDSIVSITSLNNGGILDNAELSNLEDIINENVDEIDNFVEVPNNDEEWLDLSSIIDSAIDEVNAVSKIYDKHDAKPIKLLLNDYDLKQLTPLLKMLDQDIIDSLTEGYDINLQLKLSSDIDEFTAK